MLSIFKPAPHKARLPAAEIDPTYRRLRWQIFLGIFFGYAAYYLVRKNFALAMPYLVEQGFSRGDLGFALSGISIAYGFSKFIMGCNAANNFGLIHNQFRIAILAILDPELSAFFAKH